MIARVFVRKTSFCPNDEHAYFGAPDLFTPKNYYDKVYISVTFTWDMWKAEIFRRAWSLFADEVFIGGPAYDDPGGEFEPGMFLKRGITITSRGCNNACAFCLVPKREGKLREVDVKPGNIIQDNNILACSDSHLDKVFAMLKTQTQICFKGGLESSRITTQIAERLRGLRIKELWLACDSPAAIKPLQKAAKILHKAGFTQNHLLCYALIGNDIQENEARLYEIFNAGVLPFAQLYQPIEPIEYSKAWRQFARTWSRPAAYKSMTKRKGSK